MEPVLIGNVTVLQTVPRFADARCAAGQQKRRRVGEHRSTDHASNGSQSMPDHGFPLCCGLQPEHVRGYAGEATSCSHDCSLSTSRCQQHGGARGFGPGEGLMRTQVPGRPLSPCDEDGPQRLSWPRASREELAQDSVLSGLQYQRLPGDQLPNTVRGPQRAADGRKTTRGMIRTHGSEPNSVEALGAFSGGPGAAPALGAWALRLQPLRSRRDDSSPARCIGSLLRAESGTHALLGALPLRAPAGPPANIIDVPCRCTAIGAHGAPASTRSTKLDAEVGLASDPNGQDDGKAPHIAAALAALPGSGLWAAAGRGLGQASAADGKPSAHFIGPATAPGCTAAQAAARPSATRTSSLPAAPATRSFAVEELSAPSDATSAEGAEGAQGAVPVRLLLRLRPLLQQQLQHPALCQQHGSLVLQPLSEREDSRGTRSEPGRSGVAETAEGCGAGPRAKPSHQGRQLPSSMHSWLSHLDTLLDAATAALAAAELAASDVAAAPAASPSASRPDAVAKPTGRWYEPGAASQGAAQHGGTGTGAPLTPARTPGAEEPPGPVLRPHPGAFFEPDGSLLCGLVLQAACSIVRAAEIPGGVTVASPHPQAGRSAGAHASQRRGSAGGSTGVVPLATAVRLLAAYAGAALALQLAESQLAAGAVAGAAAEAAPPPPLAFGAAEGRGARRMEASYRALRPLMRRGWESARALMTAMEKALRL